MENRTQKYLSKVREDPKVKRMLTPQEAEDGLELVIERIVEETMKFVRVNIRTPTKLTQRQKELLAELAKEMKDEVIFS